MHVMLSFAFCFQNHLPQRYNLSSISLNLPADALNQLCPTRGPWAACGPVKGFVWLTLSFRSSKTFLYIDKLCLF